MLPSAPHLALVFPALPPAVDGIGDHTARIGEALAHRTPVRILTAQRDAEPVPGVRVERAFSRRTRRGVLGLLDAVAKDPPDVLLLQFEQFSYGRWGLNPLLPFVFRTLRRRYPLMRLVLVAHEDFVPVSSWKFAVMTTWQRAQFWSLGRTADVVLCSVAAWTERYQRWFPKAVVRSLPVGSNLPLVHADRAEARDQLGFSPDDFVLGLFGTVRAQRSLDAVARTLDAAGPEAVVLYAGPQGRAVRDALADRRVLDVGCVSGPLASTCFAAMDVYLAPFLEGVTARRGSFMAGLQHGIATVSTRSPLTDPVLAEHDGRAFLLTAAGDTDAFEAAVLALRDDPERRRALGASARALYRACFDWDVLANRILVALGETTPPSLRTGRRATIAS